MDALVVYARFHVTPDGRLWTPHAYLGHAFWERYLEVYDGVRLMGRAAPAARPDPAWLEATGPGVVSAAVPDPGGAAGIFRASAPLFMRLRAELAHGAGLQLRSPDPLVNLVGALAPGRRPFGVEVVGDPHGSFAPGAHHSPLRPVYRWWSTRWQERLCQRAWATGYVSAEALQARYPPSPARFTTHYSSISLGDEALAATPRRYAAREPGAPLRLVSVGTMWVPHKGFDVLLEALPQALALGAPVHLTLVGDGPLRVGLEAQAARLGLGDRVRFAGSLPGGAAVRDALDAAELFVLPSRVEGLPRAMLEAMARGMACLGSRVGGIPELVAEDALAPPGDPWELAARLVALARDPGRLTELAAQNLARAQDYREALLRARRNALYREVRDATARWLASKSRGAKSSLR